MYRDIFRDMHDGSFWSRAKAGDLIEVGRLVHRKVGEVVPTLAPHTEPEPIPTCPVADA